MNIIDAVKEATTKNVAIMSIDRNEWIIVSGGSLRYKCNRELANLTPKDILAMNWISENDLIVISKAQIEEALKKLAIAFIDGEPTISGFDSFFDSLTQANFTNKKLRNDSNGR
jgi:hypothetical protein